MIIDAKSELIASVAVAVGIDDGSRMISLMAVVPCGVAEELIISCCIKSSNVVVGVGNKGARRQRCGVGD